MLQKNDKPKSVKAIVRLFIENDKNEILLFRSPKWKDKYVCIGGHVEPGEPLISAVKREAREEANLEVTGIEFLALQDGHGIKEYLGESRHFIFIDFIGRAENLARMKLNGELAEPAWKTLDEWLLIPEEEFGPYMKDALQRIRDRKADYKSEYVRALADYQNLKKETQGWKQEFVKFANRSLLEDILPVYDNLKLALKHIEPGTGNSIEEGLKLVLKQFQSVLSDNGIIEIKTADCAYDHTTMEAVETRPTKDATLDGKVAYELKSGYMLSDSVLYPAKVAVYKTDN